MATTLKCLGQLHKKKWHQNESGIALETGYWPLRSGNGNEKMRSKEYPDGYGEKERTEIETLGLKVCNSMGKFEWVNESGRQ
jgi:hypothetical protein